jgi:hypothetical protein
MSTLEVTSLGVGAMICAGVFVLKGKAADEAGRLETLITGLKIAISDHQGRQNNDRN